MNKKLFIVYGLALALLATGIIAAKSATTQATSLPSAKATAQINTAVGCTVSSTSNIGDTLPLDCHDVFSGNSVPVTADNFATVMSTPIKVSNSQSLFVSPSLVTGLYTNTKTKTQTGKTSTAVAEGGVYLRAVLTDSNGKIVSIADPVSICTNDILGCKRVGDDYGVVLDSREQTLSQSLSDCVVNVGTATGTCSFDSTTQLILDTTSAHTFNFIFPNVGVGTYNVEIQAAVDSSATVAGSGTSIGAAAFGLGSVTVQSVRLVNNFSF